VAIFKLKEMSPRQRHPQRRKLEQTVMDRSCTLALLTLLTIAPRIQLQADLPTDNSRLTEPLRKDKSGMDLLLIDEKAKPTVAERREFRQLVSGRVRADSDESRRVIEKVSRWVLYRLTWVKEPNDQEAEPKREQVSLAQLMDEIFSPYELFPAVPPAPDPRREVRLLYLKELKAAMLPDLRILLQTKKAVVRVNAARILHKLAQLERSDQK
jgi:hypothetical protein